MENKYKSVPVKSSEITSYSQYISRREFLKAAGIVTGSALLVGCAPNVAEAAIPKTETPIVPAGKVDELGGPANSFEDITNYNNFYEFSTNKEAVAPLSRDFNPAPWTVEVYGLVNYPKTYGIEDLLGIFTQEERIYRLRCVEAWSMVIPWTGFTLASLLNEVEPTSDAKYVRFECVFRPKEMMGQGSPFYPWPYQEGLRLDEAMNDLTILATGIFWRSRLNHDERRIMCIMSTNRTPGSHSRPALQSPFSVSFGSSSKPG